MEKCAGGHGNLMPACRVLILLPGRNEMSIAMASGGTDEAVWSASSTNSYWQASSVAKRFCHSISIISAIFMLTLAKSCLY
jgi:hypothetical protein